MEKRYRIWAKRYGLARQPYHWTMDNAELVFRLDGDEVVAEICVIGTVSRSAGTFCWAWANEAIPSCAQRGLSNVREFGNACGLGLLTEPEWPGGRAEGLEMVAVAGRILDAEGFWVDEAGDVTVFFVLLNFRKAPSGRDRGAEEGCEAGLSQ